MSSTPSGTGGAQPPLRSALKSEEDGDRSSLANPPLKGTYIFSNLFNRTRVSIFSISSRGIA